jgi:hypothetical protein
MDDKQKAELHFNWQALKEAVERMNCVLLVRLRISTARTTPRTTLTSTAT